MAEMIKARMFYQKTGRAKYISHLDVNRLMQRVLKRSKLPTWYTEGFNPHMYLTFALPLSLGYESMYECMDFRLTEELDFTTICTTLNQHMPEGFTVTGVAAPVAKLAEITAADFKITITASCHIQHLKSAWEAFWNADAIEVVKRTKRGEQIINIKPDIALLACSETADRLILDMRFPAGTEKSYNPSLLLEEFLTKSEMPMTYRVMRTAIRKANGALFE